jgi:hypothetical protein
MWEEMERKWDEIENADTMAEEANTSYGHNAVAETLGNIRLKQFQNQDSDGKGVRPSHDQGIIHAVPDKMEDDRLLVNESGRLVPLVRYQQKPDIQRRINLSRIVRATHPISHEGQGDARKSGYIIDSKDSSRTRKATVNSNTSEKFNVAEKQFVTSGNCSARSIPNRIKEVEGKSFLKAEQMRNNIFGEVETKKSEGILKRRVTRFKSI